MYHVTVNINLMVKNVIQIKSGIAIKVGKSAQIRKKYHAGEKDYTWDPATCSCKNGKYLTCIIDDSLIRCDEVIDSVAKS